MKRFLLFCYSEYYPTGGMLDFTDDFDDLESAKERIESEDREVYCGFNCHVYDTKERKIVFQIEY
jgi:hypothetical protein